MSSGESLTWRLSPLTLPAFRRLVDSLNRVDISMVVKFMYETTGRVSEVATKGSVEIVNPG